METPVLSLYDLNRIVRGLLSEAFPDLYWIRAETSDVRQNQNGHCYLEFIQKDDNNKNIIAKARGSIWANVFQMLKMYFESETGQPFTSGLKVLVQVSVEFHELYGFSLNVHNIDPTYTLGDQARNRTEILRRLSEEGVIELNKELEISEIPNRIAVISSPTAAGYEDFCNQLNNNQSGFVFYPHLFPAVMQGDKAEDSILSALDRINDYRDSFDVVVIIRGGGAASDLSCFDSYMLAASCAQFPLPIVTGIGHERDDTVLDIVSHTRVKTPTAAAEFLIGKMKETEYELLDMQERIFSGAEQILQDSKLRISNIATHFSYLLKEKTKEQIVVLDHFTFKLKAATEQFLNAKKHLLEVHEQHLNFISPENILKKGYTLTLKGNKIIKSVSQVRKGEVITTVFGDGKTDSVVE
ncbi:MAG: exodeoxyribonuclease VII large subunit [Dysgonomonas sp.]